MTDTLTVVPSPARRQRRWLVPAVVLAIVLGGIGIGLAVASRDDTSSPAASDAVEVVPIANISQACAGWAATNASGATASAWCNSMTAWMNQEVVSGRTTGMMMWADPTTMLATCRAWIATNPSSTYPTGWCDSMVDWMRSNANTGAWPSGMMSGWAGTMMTSRSTP